MWKKIVKLGRYNVAKSGGGCVLCKISSFFNLTATADL